MTDLAKKITASSSISLWRAAGGEDVESRRGIPAKDSRTSPHARVGNSSLGPRGSVALPRVMMTPACTQPMGNHWGKQQHLVLVPEASSDHVVWRTLW